MRKPAIILMSFLSALLMSCDMLTPPQQQKITLSSPQQILETDRKFSERSKEIGMRKAYYEYIGTEGVLLRPQSLPLKGAEAIDYLSLVDDDGYTLTWEPMDALISSAGDLGFTYGVYTLTGAGQSYEGTYVNIWRKQRDGSWKFVLNAGNDGISPNP